MERLTSRPSGAPEAEPPAPVVRRMRLSDVRTVVALEEEAFSTPWARETFASLLERPAAELWVLEEHPSQEPQGDQPGSRVVGYAVVWCILDQGEVANIAVAPTCRGRGWGRLLLDRMMRVAAGRGVRSLYLEVRISNHAARGLYAAAGFEQVGRRPRYYQDPVEDALVLRASLPPPDRG